MDVGVYTSIINMSNLFYSVINDLFICIMFQFEDSFFVFIPFHFKNYYLNFLIIISKVLKSLIVPILCMKYHFKVL